MNIKTIQRSAKRQGLRIEQRQDPECNETIYRVTDGSGNRVVTTNNKRYLSAFLEMGVLGNGKIIT